MIKTIKYLLILLLFVSQTNSFAAPCNFTVSISHTNVDCYGNATGSATANVSGTSDPYSYVWSTGATTSSINNITAQTYFVKVTDKFGCEVIEFVEITQPDAIEITTETLDVLCFGGNSGFIKVEATGGYNNLSYIWNNGVETANNLNLYAGFYTLSVSDENFCVLTDTFTIAQPAKLNETHVVRHVSGWELTNGAIDITVNGGIRPYQYSWQLNGNLVDTLEDIYGIRSGTYNVDVTDFNSCLLESSINVTQPPKLENSYVVTDVNCKAGIDGAIDLTVVGGVPPYTYIWANTDIILNKETQDIKDLVKGSYYVTITDFNDISITDSMYVDEPSTIQASLIPTDALCYDSSDGYIILEASGGLPPYTYMWSDNSTEQNLSNVKANNYEVLIVDNNGCSLLAEATIGQPDIIDISDELTHVTCKDQDDGIIKLEVVGGIPGYEFEWSNGETTKNVEDLPGGEYTITVTDQHNCPMVESYYINVPEFLCIWIPNAFTPNGDGQNDTWEIRNYFLYPNIDVIVFNQEGSTIFTSTGYNTAWDGKFNGNDVPSGTYYYIVDPANGDKPFTGTLTIIR